MLHAHTRLIVQDGQAVNEATSLAIRELKDGDYSVLILDDTKNKSLPQLKYLFGIVLKAVSEQLPTHPPVDALYRYFEEKFAPEHTCILPDGRRYHYLNLKDEKAKVLTEVTEKVIGFAKEKWDVKIDTDRDSLRLPEAKELWAGAYTDQWAAIINNQ